MNEAPRYRVEIQNFFYPRHRNPIQVYIAVDKGETRRQCVIIASSRHCDAIEALVAERNAS